MLLHANGTNGANISEHPIFIVSRRMLKQCYLHNNMDADCKCIIIVIYVEITVNYGKCILL